MLTSSLDRLSRTSLLAACALAMSSGARAWQPPASDEAVAVPPTEAEYPVQFSLSSGLEHQFKSDIDDGGRMSATRFNANVSTRLNFTPELNLTLGFRYDGDFYDFSGTTGLAPGGVSNPWEDIHTLTFSGVLSYDLENDVSIFGGPVMQFSREAGASWNESFIGGGVIGATFAVSPELVLGGGLGIVTQIEDSVRLFPVLVLEWEIVDNLRLSTRTVAAATGDTGVEVIYHWGNGFETAIGGAYRFRRFRLDEGGGVAPDGVGQDTHVPFWVRIGYHFTPNLSANAYVGVIAGGELRLESSSGSRIGREDYDPAAVIRATVNYRF